MRLWHVGSVACLRLLSSDSLRLPMRKGVWLFLFLEDLRLKAHFWGRVALWLIFVAFAVGLARPVLAEDEKKLGWYDSAEVAFVATGGNSESKTLGLKNTLSHHWETARFQLDAGALRAESETVTRSAVGTGANSFTLTETGETRLTAESYFLRGRYERDIAKGLYWFAGAGWEQNEFAGFDSRVSGVAGVGKVWLDDKTARLKTDAGLTFTDEEPLVDNPAIDTSFLGARLSYDYWRQLFGSTTYVSGLILDLNADDTDDLRADFVNSLSVSMTERLALKVALQLLYDHQPGFVGVPIFRPTGTPTGDVALAELDDLDSIFTVSLVANF